MQKLITLRYAGKCRKCSGTIASGERAYFLGSGKGVQHVQCPDDSPRNEPEIKSPTVDTSDSTILDYAELAKAYKDFQTDPMAVYRHEKNRSPGESRNAAIHNASWSGCTVQEMNMWISDGYRISGLSDIQSLIPAKPRRKLVYGEEGDELLLDVAWEGSDTPFIEWEKRNRKPGLSVEIGMVFSAATDSRLIAEYQTWVARALQTLDENGVDMEVNLVIKTSGANDERYSGKEKLNIRVRKAGEAADFSSWSAMFSPGGFRHLGILGIGIMVDKQGGRISHGYGSPRQHGSWDVMYDPERNVLVIGECSRGPFPQVEMTEKLVAVLKQLSS